jgi:hypothetical protein
MQTTTVHRRPPSGFVRSSAIVVLVAS